MTENTEKGWPLKSYKKNDEPELAAEEFVAEEVVVAPEAPVVEEPPAFIVESLEVIAAKMLQDAIARERAKIIESKKPFDSSADADIERVRRNEELQKKIDLLYTTGMWGAYTSYECKECPFSTLDAKLIRDHVKQHM